MSNCSNMASPATPSNKPIRGAICTVHLQLPALSPDAQRLFTDAALWPTRQALDTQLQQHFTLLEQELAAISRGYAMDWPAGQDPSRGRMARGESYRGHPYRLLDYPRNYVGQRFRVMRCLVVWGQHASAHIILKGTESHTWRQALQPALGLPTWAGWGLHTGADPWAWQPEQCQPLGEVSAAQWHQAQAQEVWRLSHYWPLDSYPACWSEALAAWAAACQAWQGL